MRTREKVTTGETATLIRRGTAPSGTELWYVTTDCGHKGRLLPDDRYLILDC